MTFKSYPDDWYTAKRTVIGLGGKIGDGLTRSSRSCSATSSRARPRARCRVDPDERPAGDAAHKASEQAHCVLGVRGYPIGDAGPLRRAAHTTVLGGGMSSRLFTEVRERRGLGYYVFASNNGYTDAGTTLSRAGVDVNRIDDAVTTIVGELRRMADEQVPADELEKARAFAKGRFVLGLESPHAMIMFGLRREVLEGTVHEPEDVLAGLDAVTAEDVQRVAQDILGGRIYLAAIGPFDDTERFEKLLPA